VNSNPPVANTKVASIVAHRTDWNAIAEIGHQWTGGGSRYGFYVYGSYGSYNEVYIRSVAADSYHRYWTGWRFSDNRYYFWMDDPGSEVGSVYYTNMTSSWSCVNAERDCPAGSYYDNVACFNSLTFRNSTWASWGNWDGQAPCSDNDVYYNARQTAVNHIDVIGQ